jgi:hypothetical protein
MVIELSEQRSPGASSKALGLKTDQFPGLTCTTATLIWMRVCCFSSGISQLTMGTHETVFVRNQ